MVEVINGIGHHLPDGTGGNQVLQEGRANPPEDAFVQQKSIFHGYSDGFVQQHLLDLSYVVAYLNQTSGEVRRIVIPGFNYIA